MQDTKRIGHRHRDNEEGENDTLASNDVLINNRKIDVDGDGGGGGGDGGVCEGGGVDGSEGGVKTKTKNDEIYLSDASSPDDSYLEEEDDDDDDIDVDDEDEDDGKFLWVLFVEII